MSDLCHSSQFPSAIVYKLCVFHVVEQAKKKINGAASVRRIIITLIIFALDKIQTSRTQNILKHESTSTGKTSLSLKGIILADVHPH